MAKKPTQAQKNKAKLADLMKQKVSTGASGFLKADLKRFIADEMINAANNKKKSINPKKDTLQKRYNQFKPYYDKIFGRGLEGHGFFTGQIEKQSKRDIEKGTEYYIKEKGIEKKVSHAELSYKMEFLAHKLSTQHDVAFTKFKPTYRLIGKGQYKVVITIPDLNEVDFEEMTVAEIMEWFDDNGVEIIISDPNKQLKNKEAKDKWEKSKKQRQNRMKRDKEKYYNEWKKEKQKRTTKKQITPKKRKK